MSDKIGKQIVLISAITSFVILLGIITFIFKDGILAFIENGFSNFLFGTEWSIEEGKFSILPLIISSLYVTLGSLIIAAPLSVGLAIFLAEIAPQKIRVLIRPIIDLLAGIPSVVYGLIGMLWLVPLIRDHIGPPGWSLLSAIIVLSIMIMPTIVSISEDSIRAVSKDYKEASLSLGATKWQTITAIIIPSSSSGITTAFILGIGRAIGEAMAVYMVIGNSFIIPTSLLDPARTLTSNIVGQIEEASYGSPHMHALFGCGIVLLLFIFLINSVSFVLRRRVKR